MLPPCVDRPIFMQPPCLHGASLITELVCKTTIIWTVRVTLKSKNLVLEKRTGSACKGLSDPISTTNFKDLLFHICYFG